MEIELVDILSGIAVFAAFVGLFGLSYWIARIGMRNRQRYEQEYWRNLREFEKFKHDLYKDDNDNTSK